MQALLETAGERLEIRCSIPWVSELITEGSGGELQRLEGPDASVQVEVESDRRGFETRGWEPLTRGAWRRDAEVVLEDVCTTGFDLHLRCTPERAQFTYRWRPPVRERAAALILRSRFHLLARAVLIQYPALWWAGTRGRVPLHASACAAAGSVPLVTAAGGIGRSTLVCEELSRGGLATGDNLAVGDGTSIWGLVEPLRIANGNGRRMPHGRQETPMHGRAEALTPDSIVVLERGDSDEPSLVSCSSASAARSLVSSTYMAGELRRYWAFAATLSAATDFGPPHPPIAEVALGFATRLPCLSLVLGKTPGARLSELLRTVEVVPCT
jgi:hypothetical protein